jgi:hypothetical protein
MSLNTNFTESDAEIVTDCGENASASPDPAAVMVEVFCGLVLLSLLQPSVRAPNNAMHIRRIEVVVHTVTRLLEREA